MENTVILPSASIKRLIEENVPGSYAYLEQGELVTVFIKESSAPMVCIFDEVLTLTRTRRVRVSTNRATKVASTDSKLSVQYTKAHRAKVVLPSRRVKRLLL